MTLKDDFLLAKHNADSELIVWNPKFNTGIPLIDEEHKKLVSLCNNFYKALFRDQHEKDWREVLGDSLNECIEYTDKHFQDEEKLMRSANFEGLPHHKAEHDAFRNKVIDMALSYNKASITEGIKFAKFLYDWILSHIAHEDKLYIPKLVQYLKENSSENKKLPEQN